MKFIRKLIASSGRYRYVTLPAIYIRSLGWRKGQRLQVSKQKGAIVIRDARTLKH